MRSNDHLQHESGASAAFVALLRFEADAYRLRAWLIHAYELLDSDAPLGADKLRLLKEDVSEAADLARSFACRHAICPVGSSIPIPDASSSQWRNRSVDEALPTLSEAMLDPMGG
ncbi:MAG TPA: hypothetical protein VFP43_04805 [Mesorhizobium sp.]|nr:hypothetical protein [Mesorhizobium sp.]